MGSRFDIGAIEIAEAVRTGQRRASDVLDQALAAIEAGNEQLGAFVHLDEGTGPGRRGGGRRRRGRRAGPGPVRRRADRRQGPRGLRRHAHVQGSLAYAARGPVAADSIHVARLRAAGAVPVGKTAAPEFGTLNFTKTKVFGVARNPWNAERTPGGSSGGSAAAVAAGLVPVATASDGGGSTRIPASFCGLVGFKPSHGRIPHPGPTGSETSVYGLLTTTVADSARHLDVTAGPDDRDRFSLPPPVVGYESAIESLPVGGAAGPLVARPRLRSLRSRGADHRRAGRPAAGRRRRPGARRRARSASPTRSAPGWAPVPWTCGSSRGRHVARGARRPDPLRPHRARADRGLPDARATPARCAAGSSWWPTPPGCSPTSTWCSRRRPRCRRSRPRARRPR